MNHWKLFLLTLIITASTFFQTFPIQKIFAASCYFSFTPEVTPGQTVPVYVHGWNNHQFEITLSSAIRPNLSPFTGTIPDGGETIIVVQIPDIVGPVGITAKDVTPGIPNEICDSQTGNSFQVREQSPAPGNNIPSPYPLPVSDFWGFGPETLVSNLVTAILPIVLGIAGFLTVIFIVISGIQFVTSSGNPEAAAAARSRLTFAIVGFVIIILAFAITQIVDRIFLGTSGVF